MDPLETSLFSAIEGMRHDIRKLTTTVEATNGRVSKLEVFRAVAITLSAGAALVAGGNASSLIKLFQ